MKRLTEVSYWDEHWNKRERPRRLWLYRDFDFETIRLLRDSGRNAAGSERPRVIELGAGGSRVLPYLGRKFGYAVSGSDFSWSGCLLLRANLRLQRVEGNVVCEDLFRSSLAANAFDVVYSSGLIEHFDDSRTVVAEHLRLLKPGGRLVLIVPNLEGLQGRIWTKLAPPLWEKHRVFGPAELTSLLNELGLDSVRSGYLGSFFIHIERGPDWPAVEAWAGWLRSIAPGCVRLANGAISLGFRLSPWRPHSRALSPAFFATGTRRP